MIWHHFSTVQFPSHCLESSFSSIRGMGTKCLCSVQFNSGFVQAIEPPIVWEEKRNSASSPPSEITAPPPRPGVCGFGGEIVCFAGCACLRVWDVVWCQCDANSVQNRFQKVRSIQFACFIGSTASSFSSVHDTAAKSLRSVRSVQFTNSSGPGPRRRALALPGPG